MAVTGPTSANSGASTSTGNSIVEYLRGVRAELKKAEWPSRAELIRLTQVVLLMLFIVAVYCGVLDSLLSLITHNLFNHK